MKRSGLLILLLTGLAPLVFALLLTGAAGAAPRPAPRPVATVQAVTGTLTVKRQGTKAFTPLAVRGSLFVGDVARTGANSRASLMFSDNSEVRMNANARVEITAPTSVGQGKKSLFRTLAGEVWANLRPGRAAQTRTAVAGVRGTEFDLRVEEDGTTTLTVLTGEVDFFNPQGAVVVGESQQSVARPGAAPTAPVTIPNAGLIIEWMLELDRALIPREKFYLTLDRSVLEAETQARQERARGQPQDPGARRDYGDVLFDGGQYAEALQEYEAADRLAPGQSETLTRLGDTLLELGRLDEAEARFRAALEADPNQVPVRVGLAWVALRRDHPGDAQKAAAEAVAAAANSAEAQTVLGLALMRQPGMLAEAQEALQAALTAEPAAYHYQARAWLALVHLAQDDPPAALQEAQAAVQLQPQSALAHGNLALVYFFHGQPRKAEREGRRAVQLNPDSVAARCALGQALLAAGDVDAAERAAAQAVALDPGLPPARYLLGVAEAQRRDYRHAARELQECLRLAPDFLPAASALARVYTSMGRKQEAVTLLTDLLPRHRRTDEVRAALGAVYYQQGKYPDAVEQYRAALQQKPNSALYRAELCRVLIDANRLTEALAEGQEAVRLAPGVGRYHAVLGLAYDFSRMTVQAEREYREALIVDPRNALAHLALGLRAAQLDPREHRIISRKAGLSLTELLRQAQAAVGSFPAVGSITQAFLEDPAIPNQLLRGGVDGEGTATGGNENPLNGALAHRATAEDGAFHSLALTSRERDHGLRPNDDSTVASLSGNGVWTTDPRTELFGRVSYNTNEQGWAGPESLPDQDDRLKARDRVFQLGAQRRLGRGRSAWVGVTQTDQHFEILDPDLDSRTVRIEDEQGTGFWLTPGRQRMDSTSLAPELRLDLALDREPTRPSVVTLGATYANLKPDFLAELVWASGPPPEIIPLEVHLDGRLSCVYGQWTDVVNDQLSFTAQVRQQRFRATTRRTRLGGGEYTLREARSHFLPSLLVSYRPESDSLVRLLYTRQAPEQDLVPLTLLPQEPLLTTEPLVGVQGSPSQTETIELDLERYLSPGDYVKLFLFHTQARQVSLEDLPAMDRVERTGVGVRYERRLRRNLFAQASYLHNRTTNDTPLAPFDGGTAPYHAPHLAGLSLNYVDETGTKAGLQLNYVGRFYQDTGALSATDRPIFPSRAYVDLLLAQEPSLDHEIFLKVFNVFNSRAIQFNDWPTGDRRIVLGVTKRF